MKRWEDAILRRKVEPVGNLVELPLHSERDLCTGTQLTARQAETDVPCGEPHLLTRLVIRGWCSSGVSLPLVSPHCLLEMHMSRVPYLSLCWNQWLTAGTSEGSPNQGNNGDWYPRIHWHGVSLVVDCRREFWAYSAHGRNWLQLS